MNNFIKNQNWRYATKKFDASKKITADDLLYLKEAIRLSVSSYGLQPYQVLIIENPEVRQQIKEVAFNQAQITDASHLFVFASYTELSDAKVDAYITNIANTRNIEVEKVNGYGTFIKGIFNPKTEQEVLDWTAKQAYIALTNLINAAAERKIDVTPMEGFIAEKVNEILQLQDRNLNAVLLAPVGFRADDDATQFDAKVRKADQDLFIHI
ncbi:NAD(P)H-dependent oxidoreductase [Flavobacterium agricola]|uniref:NAD(P)H-dependent oxidoreductase n=1 Tax=Flavobacterium agricola TaxID=2870839 RepID=A0ABY6M001_9FLAO|nr:NAD(P)H-dependent oxidoreductase [Flavobacterium agricola]UYW01607.1 NAD(P)H-dependent oxidoreductase [Flavobacterium agricola]